MSIMERLSRTAYVQSVMAEKADLSAFKQKPSVRTVLGIATLCFSYVIAWPAIAVLGYAAVVSEKAWLLAVGGPLLYGCSHLVFLLGMYLAGFDYTKIVFRWATRAIMERWLRRRSRQNH